MARNKQILVIHERDNVAIALDSLPSGSFVRLPNSVEKIRVLSGIPMGHKFALIDIAEGEAVIKYGEPIGRSTKRISQGEHVHVHNMASAPR